MPLRRHHPATASGPPALRLTMVCIAAVIGVAGCDLLPKPAPSTEAPKVNQRKVYAIGSIEPAGGVISIAAAPGDRLKALDPDVALNQLTPTDGVLGLMASYDTRLAQLQSLDTKRELAAEKHQLDIATAEAQVVAANAQLAQASAKLSEVKIQEKRLGYLEEAADIAAEDFAELERLAAADKQLVTERQLRRQANRVDQAQKDYEIAVETFVSGVAAAQTAREAALANKQAAQRTLEKLRNISPARAVDEEIRLARQALAQSVLLTPDQSPAEIDATSIKLKSGDAEPHGPYTVLKVFLNPGEAVTQTPVLQIGDLSRVVCVAEVYEADAKKLQQNQRAVIKSDAFGGDFATSGIAGRIESISRIVASPGLAPRNPLAAVDRRVIAVRVAIDPKDKAAIEEAGRWIGLQVEVEFPLPRESSNEKAPAGDAS